MHGTHLDRVVPDPRLAREELHTSPAASASSDPFVRYLVKNISFGPRFRSSSLREDVSESSISAKGIFLYVELRFSKRKRHVV